MNSASAAVPKEDPFFGIGEDFLVIKAQDYHPQLNVLFNNTNIYIDSDNDGTWGYHFIRNAGDTFDFSALSLPSPITTGARIHTNKPVEYWQQMYYYRFMQTCGYTHWGYKSVYTSVPPMKEVVSDYFVYADTWYIVTSEDININVDINNDGSVDSSIGVSKLNRGEISVLSGFARVYSDKPFYLYNLYSVVGPSGTDFSIPWTEVEKLVVAEDNTTIKADINNDGVYDWLQVYNRSVYENMNFGEGARIHSDKPIVVFTSSWHDIPFYAPPSNTVGSDLWSKTSGIYANIIGMYDNTSYYLDTVEENDLNPDYNYTINYGETKSLPDSGKVHIWGGKPFIETYSDAYCSIPHDYYGYYYSIYPYSSISSTTYNLQKYLGANEITTINVRVFNPFANTSIYNVSIDVPFPNSFSMPLGTSIELNVKKRDIRTDIIIESETITLTPSPDGGNYIFTASNTDSTLFNSLDAMQYYDMEYQLRTPITTGEYKFDSVNVEYTAKTWNLPIVSN